MWPSSTISALAGTCSGTPMRIGHFGARTAQQAGKLVFRQRVGHGRDGAQDGGRIGANGHRHGVGLAGVLPACSAKSSAPPRCESQRMMSWLLPITCWR
jgi:hypothetical protein